MSQRTARRSRDAERWAVPAAGLLFGLAYLVIGIAHGNTVVGLLECAVMLAFVVAVMIGRRRESQTAVLMAGETRDERDAMLQLRAAAATGRVLVVVLVAGLFWTLAADDPARGTLAWLCAIAGVVSIASQAWYARRG